MVEWKNSWMKRRRLLIHIKWENNRNLINTAAIDTLFVGFLFASKQRVCLKKGTNFERQGRGNDYRWQASPECFWLSRIQVGVVQDWTNTLFSARVCHRVCVFWGKIILVIIVYCIIDTDWRIGTRIILFNLLWWYKNYLFTLRTLRIYKSLPLLSHLILQTFYTAKRRCVLI